MPNQGLTLEAAAKIALVGTAPDCDLTMQSTRVGYVPAPSAQLTY